MASTVDAVLHRAADSLAVLADTAAPVEDEWQYVSDLVTVIASMFLVTGDIDR